MPNKRTEWDVARVYTSEGEKSLSLIVKWGGREKGLWEHPYHLSGPAEPICTGNKDLSFFAERKQEHRNELVLPLHDDRKAGGCTMYADQPSKVEKRQKGLEKV